MAGAETTLDRRAFMKGAAAAVGAGLLYSLTGQPRTASASVATDLDFASALDVAKAIREKKVSSVEITEHIISRIGNFNPELNSIVVDMTDDARKAARAADAALARGEHLGPFHGVPVTVKEAYNVTGYRTTVGAPFLKENQAADDAEVVRRLKESGAVILGKTNVPFMLSDMQSYNAIYGTTNNPWDASRTCGGSTGGGAASLAAGLSFLFVGSDIGGSIRTPASFCGVYRHKPTLEVVSLYGHVPPLPNMTPAPRPTLPVGGPLARDASDLMAAMKLLGGPRGDDARAYSWKLPPPRAKRLQNYRIGYVIDDPLCPVVPEVKVRLQMAIDALRNAGATVQQGWPEGVDPKQQIETYLFLLFTALRPPVVMDAALDDISAIGLVDIFNKAMKAPAAQVQAKEFQRMAARRAWQNYFTTHDAFLMPVDFVPAFPHDHSDFGSRTLQTSLGKRSYFDMLYWISFATLTGLPATSAPVGTTKDGLPVGIQILGPYMEDATPIDIAAKLADVVGGFQPPPGYAS